MDINYKPPCKDEKTRIAVEEGSFFLLYFNIELVLLLLMLFLLFDGNGEDTEGKLNLQKRKWILQKRRMCVGSRG